MAVEAERFSYSTEAEAISSSLPYLPLTLNYRHQTVMKSGLLDTGAAVNVLPYHIGIELGASWEAQTKPVKLTGNEPWLLRASCPTVVSGWLPTHSKAGTIAGLRLRLDRAGS